MEPSVNFATIYRPSTFAEVVGQEIPKSVLKKIAAADGISARAIFLKGAWGSGKCVHPDTIVKTNEGFRKAESLTNEEFTIVGDKNQIALVQKNSDTRVLNIETESGRHIKVTGNHPVMVWNGSEYTFKEATALEVGDCLVEDLTRVPYNGELDEDAYMIGLLLGDGTLTRVKSIVFLTTDLWLRDWVIQYCKRTFCYYTLSTIEREGKATQYSFTFNKFTRISQLCDYLGILGHSSKDKVLPNNFWSWKFYSQVSLLQGVIDTDGAVNKDGSVELGMNAYALLTGLQHVLSGLGISTRLVKRAKGHRNKDGNLGESWRLSLCRWTNDCSFEYICRMPRKVKYLKSICDATQSKRYRFVGMADKFREIIYSCGLKYSNEDRSKLNMNRKDEFSLQACKNWQDYLNSRGVECSILLPNTAPDFIKSIKVEQCSHTIDIQCVGNPIFYTNGVITHNTTLARIFAKAMNCESFKQNGDVCNECASCKEASAKNSQLYYEFDSSVVGNVDAIRNLQDQFAYIPDGRRVVVFDEIHAASKAALNAMLKMVEDGVPNTIFVFASTEDILPTIKSRSICLEITPIPHELMKERLQQICNERGINITSSDLDQICIKSEGHMRDALSILQLYSLVGAEGIKSSYSLVVKFFKAALSKKFDVADSLLKEILKYNIVDIKNSLYLFIRNCYTASSSDSLYAFLQTGVINKIFGYFFSPVQQAALQDEVGLEIAFRSFLSKLNKV